MERRGLRNTGGTRNLSPMSAVGIGLAIARLYLTAPAD